MATENIASPAGTEAPAAPAAGNEDVPVFGDGKQASAGDVKADTQVSGKPEGEQAAPAELDIKLPDGFEADKSMLDEFRATAKEAGLDSAKAQKFVDLYAKAVGSFDGRMEAAKTHQVTAWEKASTSDKEFGGAKYKENLTVANSGLAKYATPELKSFLKDSGLASHPEVVRLFYRIGKANAEDTAAGTMQHRGRALTTTEKQAEALRKMYPKSPEMFE